MWICPIRAWATSSLRGNVAVAVPYAGRRNRGDRDHSNPATGETLKTFDEMSEADVEHRLAAAATAHASYRLTSFAERAGWMHNAAGILDKEQDQIAAMMTTEMGKTLAAARQEVAKCASACRYYAEHAAGYLADEPADAGAVGAENAHVSYQPLGPVLAIMPWNFPLWQAMRFAARPDGRQRRAAEARLERAADRIVHPRLVRGRSRPRPSPTSTWASWRARCG